MDLVVSAGVGLGPGRLAGEVNRATGPRVRFPASDAGGINVGGATAWIAGWNGVLTPVRLAA
ncbi:MAG: hypothetical protein QOK40_2766 [Miltoncostaeaceae bacterium]|nr:hypothetical protein [Miltoncostaeaceae bacterium]